MQIGPMDWSINSDDINLIKEIKCNVAAFETYFRKNYDRYNEFRLIIYDTSLSQQDKLVLTSQQRPTLEANLLPAQISRLLGEFSIQEFSFDISPTEELERKFMEDQYTPGSGVEANSPKPPMPPQPMQQALNGAMGGQQPGQPPAPGAPPQAPQQGMPPQQQQPNMFPPPPAELKKEIKIAEGLSRHLNYMFTNTRNHHVQQEFMKDLLTGGWSVLELEVQYDHPMSMTPRMIPTMPEDRTLCGFDPKARLESKEDGDFCYKKFLMSREDFELMYPESDINAIKFESSTSDSDWTFKNNDIDVLIICDYWKKEKKAVDIVKLSTGDVVPVELYKKLSAANPEITKMGKPRKTIVEKICRYRVIDNQVVEREETLFKGLPLIFGRGDGAFLKYNSNETVTEQLIPYIYHARDMQRFRNYTLNSLANEIENIMQHKLMVAQEAYPTQPQWQMAYTNYQNAAVLFYKSRYDDNPDQLIPNPVQPIPRMPAPPEIMQAFAQSGSVISNILGTMESPTQNNINDLSGEAVVQAQMHANPTAIPYITGMAHALERVAQLYIDTLPEFIEHYENLPIITEKAKKEKFNVNGKTKDKFNYFPGQLKVDIKVGASYAVQKQQALLMVSKLMGMSPQLQQFFSTKGLPYILDNLEGKNVDALKLEIEDWVNQQSQIMQQQTQMQMQMQQQEMQNNPAMIKAQVDQQKLQMDGQNNSQKLQLETQKMQMQHQIDMLKLELEHNKLDAELHMSYRKDVMEIEKSKLDHHDRSINTILKAEDQHHKHSKESFESMHGADMAEKEHEHKKTQDNKPKPAKAKKE